jgi:ketosteroid isomerase-like protein
MRRTAVVLALATLAGCNKPAPPPPPPGPPPIDEAAAKSGVDALWARWVTADTSGSFEAWSALFADDIVVDFQGSPTIMGKAAWKVTSFSPSPHTTWVINNDLVYQGGNYTETYIEKKKARGEYGRFIAAMTKGADGNWKFSYLMAITDSTVAAR